MPEARKQKKEAYIAVDTLIIIGQLYKEPNNGNRVYDAGGSVLKYLSWNIKGLTSDKLNSFDFMLLLNKHDITVLSETWTDKHSNMQLKDYKANVLNSVVAVY